MNLRPEVEQKETKETKDFQPEKNRFFGSWREFPPLTAVVNKENGQYSGRTRGQTRVYGRLHLGSAKSAKAKLASWMKAHTRPSAQPPAETGNIDRKL
jgi:hypothetical protein